MWTIIMQSFNKEWKLWSDRLHKLGTPEVLRTEGQTDTQKDGPTEWTHY